MFVWCNQISQHFANIDQFKYSGYCIGFDRKGSYSIGDEIFKIFSIADEILIIFRVGMTSFPDIDNKKKDILILGEDPTQGLEHTVVAERLCLINNTKENT